MNIEFRKAVIESITSIKHAKFGDDPIKEFCLVYPVFLMKFLELDYDFTQEQMHCALDKKNIDDRTKLAIKSITEFISKSKYDNQKINKKEFYNILDAALMTIEELSKTDSKPKLFSSIRTEYRCNKFIKKSREFLVSGEVDKAKKYYNMAVQIYIKMNYFQRIEVYDTLLLIYNKLKEGKNA